MSGIKVRILLSKKNVFLDVDFEIAKSQTLVIRGESGVGKTTLLRCIAGLEMPDEAYISVNGELWQNSKNNFFLPINLRKIGYVAQKNNLFPHLSVKENLLFGYKRIDEKEHRANYQEVVEQFKIGNLIKRDVAKLSGGEAQKIAIARAILANPDILLLDEPLSALDHKSKTEILETIKNLKQKLSIPIIYVSHSQEEGNYIADKVITVFSLPHLLPN
jgi:molybdate transport system ATP-binding protein